MAKPLKKNIIDDVSERVKYARSLIMWGVCQAGQDELYPRPCAKCDCGFREAMIAWDYDNPELELICEKTRY